MFERYKIYQTIATGERTISYGDEDDLKELLADQGLTWDAVELIPISEATAEEIAQLIGEEAENANYHSLTGIAESFLQGLKREGFSKEDQTKALQLLASAMGPLLFE